MWTVIILLLLLFVVVAIRELAKPDAAARIARASGSGGKSGYTGARANRSADLPAPAEGKHDIATLPPGIRSDTPTGAVEVRISFRAGMPTVGSSCEIRSGQLLLDGIPFGEGVSFSQDYSAAVAWDAEADWDKERLVKGAYVVGRAERVTVASQEIRGPVAGRIANDGSFIIVEQFRTFQDEAYRIYSFDAHGSLRFKRNIEWFAGDAISLSADGAFLVWVDSGGQLCVINVLSGRLVAKCDIATPNPAAFEIDESARIIWAVMPSGHRYRYSFTQGFLDYERLQRDELASRVACGDVSAILETARILWDQHVQNGTEEDASEAIRLLDRVEPQLDLGSYEWRDLCQLRTEIARRGGDRESQDLWGSRLQEASDAVIARQAENGAVYAMLERARRLFEQGGPQGCDWPAVSDLLERGERRLRELEPDPAAGVARFQRAKGEMLEARGDLSAALAAFEVALAANPRIGVKKRAEVLRRRLGA